MVKYESDGLQISHIPIFSLAQDLGYIGSSPQSDKILNSQFLKRERSIPIFFKFYYSKIFTNEWYSIYFPKHHLVYIPHIHSDLYTKSHNSTYISTLSTFRTLIVRLYTR